VNNFVFSATTRPFPISFLQHELLRAATRQNTSICTGVIAVLHMNVPAAIARISTAISSASWKALFRPQFRPQPHQRIKNHANDKEDCGENDRKSHVGRYVAKATPEDEDLTQRIRDLGPGE